MSDADKKNDLLKELEIQSILEESRELADEEQMKINAQKYKAKPKMDEIFSNADRKPRLTNQDPLNPDSENNIVGEKTATTMQASLMMESGERKTPEKAPSENTAPNDDDNKIVTLSPEYAENTKFSQEIIGEVDTFKEPRRLESFQSIDIELDDNDNKKESETAEAEQTGTTTDKPLADSQPPRKVIAKVPVYQPDEQRTILNVKAGRFSAVVAHEYEEYLHSTNPSVRAHVIKPEPKTKQPPAEPDKKDKRSAQEKILSAVVGFFSKEESDEESAPENEGIVEDYTSDDDVRSIKSELNHNIKNLFARAALSGVLALVSIILTIVTRLFPAEICSAVPVAPAAYAVFNLILMGLAIYFNRVAFMSGLTPLQKFKGNSDTAMAAAGTAAVIQTLVSFFSLGDMTSFSVNYYCVVSLLAFFANNVGKLFMVLRVKDNFRFVSAKGQLYAAKIYNNEQVANKMLSGTASEKTIIAYQHKTDFPSNFLKISYAPDPSEDLSSKIAPITCIAAIIITVMYGIIKGSFADAINTLALITALAVPVSTLVAVNLPIRKLCKKLLNFGAMLSGYPSIKQFCDTTAVMIDAAELFPADSIELEGIKTYEEYNIDESLLCGIAILKEANNPIANAFDSVVVETNETLPEVESVLYEDDLGLVGWINGERILVGSRALMEKYKVEVPAIEAEQKYTSNEKQVTYLSRAGRLIAMLVTRYHANPELKTEMQRAEANGISFLIRTTDYNITDELVANMYNLFYRSIKILPTGLGNVLKEAQGSKEESSRAYLITHGNPASLSRAISGCVRIKHNISIATVIQVIAIVLGILVASTLVLYANVGVMGSLEVLIYTLFWSCAAIIAPLLQKP